MLMAGVLLVRGTAMAEGISGSVELSQTATDSKSTDASGLSSSTKGSAFFQRYQLNYNETLYPYLNLRAGGTFDKTISESKGPDGDTRATDTSIFPSAALTLNNPFVSSGVGISRREEKVEATGGQAATNIQDFKNAFLNFRPEGLPTLDMQAQRSHTYDKDHEATDSENDLFSASTRFTPVKNLDLAYNVSLNNSKDLLSGVTSDSMSQNERASYSNRFFNNRVSFSTDYSAVQSTTKTQTGNGGEVAFQLFPFSGLSDISDTPTLEVLSPNQALIDGNLTASSGMNIGQGVSSGGDTRLRNVGLDFVNTTSVNTLYLYVDRQLPTSASDTLAWDIYTSSDNQNWTTYQTGLHATFDPFTNRFELLFPDVTTRYIKAAVRPLSVTVLPTPGTDISNVFITEFQAFIRKSSAQATGKTQQGSQLFDANVSTQLLEKQLLVYSVFFSEARSSGGPSTQFLTNALSSAKQFNAVFSGFARVARDDSRDSSGKSVAYSGTASLSAVPLPTLSHSLVVSARTQELNGQSNSSESVFLNNSAALYQGIDVSLSGGVSFASTATGGSTESTLINAGASIVPNKSLTISMNHSESESNLSGGAINRAVTTTGGIAWAPLATVYLAYSITKVSATNTQSETMQNYSASWSPFSSGALTLTASYGESWQTQAATRDRVFSSGALLRIGPRIFLTAGYSVTKSTAPSQTADNRSLSTDLRMTF
jgi:hypothetical protein